MNPILIQRETKEESREHPTTMIKEATTKSIITTMKMQMQTTSMTMSMMSTKNHITREVVTITKDTTTMKMTEEEAVVKATTSIRTLRIIMVAREANIMIKRDTKRRRSLATNLESQTMSWL